MWTKNWKASVAKLKKKNPSSSNLLQNNTQLLLSEIRAIESVSERLLLEAKWEILSAKAWREQVTFDEMVMMSA